MKQKKKPSKPIGPKSVFQLACKFAATEQYVRSRDNPQAGFMASPSMVLSAFAIELFLKCLLLLESKEIDRIHSLNVLYRRLSHKQKRRIDEVWEQEARPKLDKLRRKFGLPHPTDLPSSCDMRQSVRAYAIRLRRPRTPSLLPGRTTNNSMAHHP